jgi:hypothetical protein
VIVAVSWVRALYSRRLDLLGCRDSNPRIHDPDLRIMVVGRENLPPPGRTAIGWAWMSGVFKGHFA